MKNELRRHQKSDKIKWIIAFAAILLLIGGMTMICMQLFTPYKPSNGFKKAETTTTQAVDVGVKRAAVGGDVTMETIYDANRTVTVTPDSGATFSVSVHCTLVQVTRNMSVSFTATVSADLSQYTEYRAFKLFNDTFSVSSPNGAGLSDMHSFSTVTTESVFDGLQITCEKSWTLVPLPEAPTKEGYTFTGWYTDEACTQKYEGETVREDVTLYAGWQINTYTVTYDANGGTACDPVTVNWNTAPTLPTTTRIGYTFLGWFDGDTQYTDAPVKENKTLTAHWEILTFTVTFMSDGQVYKTMTVEYGTSLTDVMATNELAVYNVVAYSGLTMAEDGTELEVTADAEVEIQPATGWDKTVKYVKANWIWLTVCVAGAAVVIGIVAALASHSGKRRYYR